MERSCLFSMTKSRSSWLRNCNLVVTYEVVTRNVKYPDKYYESKILQTTYRYANLLN